MNALTTIPLLALLLATDPADDAELKLLEEHVELACAPVRETPGMFPFRAFPLGPLSLEVRNASSAEDARERRAAHLARVAKACALDEEPAAPFDCGEDCAESRLSHLRSSLARLRTVADGFRRTSLDRLAIWAPRGEMRVDDVFVMDGRARQARPSPQHGYVPSGIWKDLGSLEDYLRTRDVDVATVRELADGLRAAGASAITRDGGRLRVVGVGIGDKEAGLLLGAGEAPKAGASTPDGRRYVMVERLADDAYFYETE